MGQKLDAPTATLTTTRAVFDGLILQTVDIGAAMQSGDLQFAGDPSVIGALFGALDRPTMSFNIVTP
jgi:alkyl sulfatase BDS1-like metallo-beta-lactamase superfamily hydrolase